VAVSQLPEHQQDYTRYRIAQAIDRLYQREAGTQPTLKKQHLQQKKILHRETTANNQLDENMTTKPNIFFDVILRHTQPPHVTHNTTNRSPRKP
jgi:hypothetical protein